MGVLKTCLKIVGWLPVVFITAVILWSYFAYVVELCIFTVAVDSKSYGLAALFLVCYHVFLIMFLWAYYQTIFTPHPGVPAEFYLTSGEVQRVEAEDRSDLQQEVLKEITRDKALPVYTRTYGGGIRFCHICKIIKPDRCHHCSVCDQCILKMDHHCPWVNNCVGYRNYKFFVLFLMYALLFCLYVAVTTLPFFIQFWKKGLSKQTAADFQTVFLCLLAAMFCLSVIALLCVHIRLTLSNQSTLGTDAVLKQQDSEISSNSAARFHILFLFLAAAMFAISVTILFCMHIRLSLVNQSTLESFRAPVFRHGPDKEGFSRGSACANFRDIFGINKYQWFLPVFSSVGDGVNWPIQARDQDSDRLLDDDRDEELQSPSEGTPTREKQEIRQSIQAGPTYNSTNNDVVVPMEPGTGDRVQLVLDPGHIAGTT